MMNKRTFLKYGSLAGGALLLSPLVAWGKRLTPYHLLEEDAFKLPDLPYDFNALEPHIDETTMRTHHGKHHAGYVANLNKAVAGSRFAGVTSLRKLMPMIAAADTAVRNNGGGHFNHSLFWKILTPKTGTQPSEELAKAINSTFGSMDAMKEQLMQAAKTRFGSGWAWLSVDKTGKLFISSTANQDNPLMYQVVEEKGYPILGIDVWEHAYYLKYKNLRGDYLQAVWNVLNWEEISKQFRVGNHPFVIWPELDAYHDVMSATFHPMEEGNLAPIKARSAELAAGAKVVAKSNFPARFDNGGIRSTVKQLQKDSAALHKLIQKGTDDTSITTALTALHDVFHNIIGMCMEEEH